ncbi:MADCA protein, partial [Sakesphorus luctuosus]|nr:MADCA protein [Sakesphorus luctuosus]
MEPAPVLLLLLGLLWGCSGHPADRLVVTPKQPVVPFGGSTELNCSLACAGGRVEWRGLDTALGTITSFATHSILHINNATVATEGMKICQGSCHGQHYQQTVDLKVYALPDTLQLETVPHALHSEHPAKLHCSAMGVHPIAGLALTWYRGHQALENRDFNAREVDEELYDIESTLAVDATEVAEGVEFRCEMTLHVGQETFTRVASVVASAGDCSEATCDRPCHVFTATSTSPSTARPMTTTALPPGPGISTHDPTTPWDPHTGTTLELAAATTEHAASQDLVTSSPMAAATQPGSGTTGPGPSVGSAPACRLQIWSLPPTGTQGRALRIECHAQCAGNATVRWLRTPVALSQYRQEATGGSSALWLDRAEPWHQGHYQCVLLGRLDQVANLELMVMDGSFSSSSAIAGGAAASLLGLVVTGAVSRRLWKRFRSRWEPS